jgi:hypothetical protein
MTRSFVLGNGTSRLNIAPKQLTPYGLIYGCNALYREFSPDYLIAVDPKMILEIRDTGYQLSHQVWTNSSVLYKDFVGFNYFTPSMGWSSGPTALNMAAKEYPDEIYIFGFDFTGINNFCNNVYADTANYIKSTDIATYWGNWEKQTEQVIKAFPTIRFYRVVDEIFYDPPWKAHNFKNMKYSEFLKQITTW